MFLSQERQTAARSAAKTLLASPRRINHFSCKRGDLPRLIEHAAIPAQITRIVKHDLLSVMLLRQFIDVPGHEFAMMLDRRGLAEFAPVRRNRPHAVWTNRNDLLHVGRFQRLQILLGELLEDQIVTEPPRRIARAPLFSQHPERRSQVPHHSGERSDDLPALWIVAAHASQPQTVFLGSVEDREFLFLNELLALARREAE